MKQLIAHLILVLIVAVAGSSCRRSTAPDVLPIEQVVAKPQYYDHKLLTIHGCYVTGFERSTLQPCQAARQNQAVSVEDAAAPLTRPSEVVTERSTPPERPLLFEYNETRSSAAWDKLNRELVTGPKNLPEHRLEVTMVGQFDTLPSPNPKSYGFGHLSQCSHRLLLLDVLEAKPLHGHSE